MPSAARPNLTIDDILVWADRHHDATGKWPSRNSGDVLGQPGEKWSVIHANLYQGLRGLPGNMTLAGLLAEHRGRRSRAHLSVLDESTIIEWAEDHHRRTGCWPTMSDKEVLAAPVEDWLAIDHALRKGTRGLPGESSLAKLLSDRGLKSTPKHAPRLTYQQILRWADRHKRVKRQYPTAACGLVIGAPEESWHAIASALLTGSRGLPTGLSLAGLLEKYRGRRNPVCPPPLTYEMILKWADDHFKRSGNWPTCDDGAIRDQPGESWTNIDQSLRLGQRGLPGGDSLARMLDRRRWDKRQGRRTRKLS